MKPPLIATTACNRRMIEGTGNNMLSLWQKNQLNATERRKMYQLLNQHPDIMFRFYFAQHEKNASETIKNNERKTQ